MPRHFPRPLSGLRLGLLVLCVGALPGCVSHQMYHPEPADYLRQLPIGDDTDLTVDLAFIEFDDQGQFWNIDQLQDTLALIAQRNREAERGVLVLTFVHGWKNNADLNRGKGNAVEFRDSLVVLGQLQRLEDGSQPDHVVGVYLGWRGVTTRLPFVEQLTFWDRRVAADRISSHAMRETLYRVGETTKQRETSKAILVGHSMGGQIVGDAMADALTTALLDDHPDGIPVLADLVMMINPSRDGLAASQLVSFLKRRHARVVIKDPDGNQRPGQGPLIVSITSKADSATRVVYPLGRGLATALGSFRPSNDPALPDQRDLVTRTEGHVDELVSHQAYLDDAGEVVLETIPDAYNDTPYWIVRVAADICNGHSDLQNPNLDALIQQLYVLNGAYDTDFRNWIVTGKPADASLP